MTDTTVAPPSAAPAAALASPRQPEVVINQNPSSPPSPSARAAAEPPGARREPPGGDPARVRPRQQSSQGQGERRTQSPSQSRRGQGWPQPAAGGDRETRPQEAPGRPAARRRGQFAPRAQGQWEQSDPESWPMTARDAHNGQHRSSPVPIVHLARERALPRAAAADGRARQGGVGTRRRRACAAKCTGCTRNFNAYQQYRSAAEAFSRSRSFHQMAAEHGTTLDQALHNYTSMEQKLRADSIAGLDVIVNNLGLKTPDGQPIGCGISPITCSQQSPDQLEQCRWATSSRRPASRSERCIRKLQGLKNALQQMHTAQQFTYTRSQVDQFADSHPRFDELGTLIEQELELGFDLETAYRRAELLAPATHAAQTGTPCGSDPHPCRQIHLRRARRRDRLKPGASRAMRSLSVVAKPSRTRSGA